MIFLKKESTIRKWEKIIEDYEESGLSVIEYCNKTGVNEHSLRHRIQDFKTIPNQISEVLVVDEPCVINSVNLIVNGIELQFDSSIDSSVLKTIIKACGNL